MSDSAPAPRTSTIAKPTIEDDRRAKWQAIEEQKRNLERASHRVEQTARALELKLRSLAKKPVELIALRPQLEREALAVRDQRQEIQRATKALERLRLDFWTRQIPTTRSMPLPRYAVEIDNRSEHTFWTGLEGELMKGGVFIATWDCQPIGSQLEVILGLPGLAPVSLRARVAWAREHSPFTADLPPGLGVVLIDLPNNIRTRAEEMLVSRPADLYDCPA